MDNSQNGGRVVVDGGQHQSSWFELVRAPRGEFANRGYLIKTFAGKALDLEGGNLNNGNIVQYDPHFDWNQVWLVQPADQPLSNNSFGQGQGQWGQGQNQWGQGQGQNQFVNPYCSQKNSQGGIFKGNTTYALICFSNQSKCLQITQDRHMEVGDYQGAIFQKYLFEFDAIGKSYRIRSAANGEYINGPGISAGVDIVTKPKGDEYQLGELWSIEPSKKMGAGYCFKSFSSHTIDIPGGNVSNGVRVQKHGFNGNHNQTFLAIEN